ncbi:MAG: IS1 family transposase [Desulfobulbaceae bacterium]|nr:IS1 family transposase [Desulfobulbaceae bacterium]MDR3089242.1 IS1 family transposase [Desulfobulbaceae bacterium]MDR3090419.1 IS1 family transposase [Desulfobulbaceae bacterium]
MCFSKNKDIHKAVIGTFINTFFFDRKLCASTIL